MANRTRAQLSTDAISYFPNNTSQLITPQDLRDWLTNGIESFVTQKDKSTFQNAFYECRGVSINAASTTDLGLATGNFLHVIGAPPVTISSFGDVSAGARFVLCFDIPVTLTYNATTLIIPGAASITTAAGDCLMLISEGSGNWRVISYFPGGGLPVGTISGVTAGTGLSGGGTAGVVTLNLANVSPDPSGSYTNADITVDAQGRITAASNGSGGGGGIPGGSDGQIQYNNGLTAFGGVSDLTWDDVNNVLTINTPRIGQSNGNGHFHMHSANSAPTGITDYLTMFWQKATRAIGFRSETDTYTTNIQLTAPTADRTYTLPDATGNVVIDSASQTLTNKTITSPSITTPAITTPAITGVATLGNGTSAGEIRLLEGSGGGSDYIAIKSPATIPSGGVSYTLPGTDGSAGYALQTNGSGTLSWANVTPVSPSKYLKTTIQASITNQTTETLIQSLLIPANTFAAGDMFNIYYTVNINGGGSTGSNTATILRINTSSSLSGSILLSSSAEGTSIANPIYSGRIHIDSISSVVTTRYGTIASVVGPTVSTAINWAVDQYLIVSGNVATRTKTFLSLYLQPL